MRLQDSVPWPPQPKGLEHGKFILPNKLNLTLKSLLNDHIQLSHTDRLRGQGIIYAATKGRLRTLILLP